MLQLKKEEDNFGTREWSSHSANCIDGCSHNCRYCYARSMAARFKRIRPQVWKYPLVRKGAFDLTPKLREGVTMFPTSHDIEPEFLDPCIRYLRLLLAAGNTVLITSKPHAECIGAICNDSLVRSSRDRVSFMFTIGSMDSDVLRFWEPGAPSFDERLAALRYATDQGYRTNVSIEPMLDAHVERLIATVNRYVLGEIWVGLPNNLLTHLRLNGEMDCKDMALDLLRLFTDEKVLALCSRLASNPKVRWKDSVRKVLQKRGALDP